MVQLHLGCGKRYIPGFIHIDLADFSHIDYKTDVSDLSMFGDNSVDLIYTCHVLEYFDRIQVKDVLKEWHRVLKPKGTLRIAVPDFEALVEVYQQYSDLSLIIGPLYGRWEIEGSKKVVYHRTVYDFESLKNVLESAGFVNIHRYDWRKTIHKDYDDYSQAYIPHMDKEHGILISLNVEGEKI